MTRKKGRGKKRLFKVLIVISIIILILFIGFNTNRYTKGLNQYETENFIFYYDKLKQETLNDMEKVLERNYNKSNNFFKIQTKEKTTIVIYNSVNQFQRRAYGLFMSFILKDWSVGGALKGSIYLTSPENPDKMHNYTDMLEILVHEYTHTQVWQIKPYVDIWIDEGLAVYFANQKNRIIYEIPTFEQMQAQSSNDFVNANGYTFSYYYIDFLLKNYDNEQIIKLIKTDNYEESLGKSKKVIYDQWIESLKAENNLGD